MDKEEGTKQKNTKKNSTTPITKNTITKRTQQNKKKETNKQPQNIQQTTAKNISYPYAKKLSFTQWIKQNIPPEFEPTDKTAYIFGGLFLLVSVLALASFPFGAILSGNVDITITAGIPWHFLEISLSDPGANPLLLKGLILDIILYILLAYILDVALNFLRRVRVFPDKEEQKKKPKSYVLNETHETIADIATKKFIERREAARNKSKQETTKNFKKKDMQQK